MGVLQATYAGQSPAAEMVMASWNLAASVNARKSPEQSKAVSYFVGLDTVENGNGHVPGDEWEEWPKGPRWIHVPYSLANYSLADSRADNLEWQVQHW